MRIIKKRINPVYNECINGSSLAPPRSSTSRASSAVLLPMPWLFASYPSPLAATARDLHRARF